MCTSSVLRLSVLRCLCLGLFCTLSSLLCLFFLCRFAGACLLLALGRGLVPPSVVCPSARWSRCLLCARRFPSLSCCSFLLFFVGRCLVVPLSLVVGLFSSFLSFSSLGLLAPCCAAVGSLGSMGNQILTNSILMNVIRNHDQ